MLTINVNQGVLQNKLRTSLMVAPLCPEPDDQRKLKLCFILALSCLELRFNQCGEQGKAGEKEKGAGHLALQIARLGL